MEAMTALLGAEFQSVSTKITCSCSPDINFCHLHQKWKHAKTAIIISFGTKTETFVDL